MKKANKKQATEQHFADGKTEVDYGPTTLDRLCGVTVQEKYAYKTVDEYDNYLQELSRGDLLSHATKMGILPTDDRDRTIKRLLSSFTQYVNANTPITRAKTPRQISNDAAKILAEGR